MVVLPSNNKTSWKTCLLEHSSFTPFRPVKLNRGSCSTHFFSGYYWGLTAAQCMFLVDVHTNCMYSTNTAVLRFEFLEKISQLKDRIDILQKDTTFFSKSCIKPLPPHASLLHPAQQSQVQRASLTTRRLLWRWVFSLQCCLSAKKPPDSSQTEEGEPCRDWAPVFLCVPHLGLSHKISFGKIIIPTTVREPSFMDKPIKPSQNESPRQKLHDFLSPKPRQLLAHMPFSLCNKEREKGSIPLCGKVEIGNSALCARARA